MENKIKKFLEVVAEWIRMEAICWFIRTGGESTTCTDGADCEGCPHNQRFGLFEGMDLSGVDLREVDFSKIAGKDHYLGKIPMDRVNFRGANLCGCDLQWVDLRGADLREAILCGANLEGVDLRGADLRGADLSPLPPRDIDGYAEETILVDAHLEGALLCDANLEGAVINNAHIGGTDFMSSNMCEACLHGVTGNANFQEANLEDVLFTEARLQNSAFDNADLVRVDFGEAKTEGCSFHGAIMEDITFDGASGDIIEASDGMTDAIVVLDRFGEENPDEPLDEIERLQ